ncbi:MAG TPA: glycosyltransferase family 1 protein [Mycobacteriales bacterium]|nr:glycosyltransferase family 1 protein [Mycobacteriales bacterium]
MGLDVTPVINGGSGIARYAALLQEGLAARPDIDVRPYAIGRRTRPTDVPHRHLPVPLRVVHEAWRRGVPLPVTPLTGRVDVVHCTDLVPPPTRRATVVTIHDVLALTHPQYFTERTVQVVRDTVARLPRVQRVITTCHATADAISEVTGFDRTRIEVVRVGHRAPTGAPAPSPVEGPYVLAVGVVQPRKSFDVLVEAMHLLGPDAPRLVIAGPVTDESRATVEVIERLRMGERVSVLDRVDDVALEALYRNAVALCHPSVAEGFGSPALEALGYGTPLVAADIPSVHEMAAGAARLVPLRDAAATADALRRVWDEPEETARLVAAGRERAADYTWERMVPETVDVYRRAAGA